MLGLLTGECSGSATAGAAACMIMAIVPAHIMRSVGGGYDNESIALTAMCCTFFCWCRSLRHDPSVTDGRATRDSYVWGLLTGLAYVYMVSAPPREPKAEPPPPMRACTRTCRWHGACPDARFGRLGRWRRGAVASSSSI